MNFTRTIIALRGEPRPVRLHDFVAGGGPEAAAVLSDLDGCLISGDTVLPGTHDLVARAGDRLWVVSNNSSDTAETLSNKLRQRLGLVIPAERILLAGEQSIRFLAETRPGTRVALFASAPIRSLAQSLGLWVTRGEGGAVLPDLVLLSRDHDFSLADLERVMRLVHLGVPVQISNCDLIHPAADGAPVPETGALLAALKVAFPDLEAPSLGKPDPHLVSLALERAGVEARDAIFIGDTDATDGGAARAAGVPFVQIARPEGAR